MLRSAAGKVVWLGRATVFLVGLAVILALVLGVASTALGANGDKFVLGKTNVATLLTKLGGSKGVNGAMLEVQNNNPGTNDTALSLKVQADESPLTVSGDALVTNLNADELDGKDAGDIGVNGAEQVVDASEMDSSSPKTVNATCPEGKIAIAGGARLQGAFTNIALNESHRNFGDSRKWQTSAHEVNATADVWSLETYATCVLAGSP